MSKKTDYFDVIDTFIQGIPCKVGLTYFFEQKPYQGSLYNCPSDIDWYGYIDYEYDVLDRKGYKAEWLKKKIKETDVQQIHEDIMYSYREYEKNKEDYDPYDLNDY